MNNKVPEQTIINLYKIADHLEKNVTDEQFDISIWRGVKYPEEDRIFNCNYISKKYCGTIGCAIGHAVFIEGLEPIERDFFFDSAALDFNLYRARILQGISYADFDYAFGVGNQWDTLKKTRTATIARIRELADNGGVLNEN